jgi:hypothetical protein
MKIYTYNHNFLAATLKHEVLNPKGYVERRFRTRKDADAFLDIANNALYMRRAHESRTRE